jgi:hypothetical protein
MMTTELSQAWWLTCSLQPPCQDIYFCKINMLDDFRLRRLPAKTAVSGRYPAKDAVSEGL